MEPWYRIRHPRQEVREGRSFNPDEFAIALEQVVAGTAPEDYREPTKFFARSCFTSDLREHAGMVLRRLAGETSHTAPVLTLITQFGGGKTHTLTALYHIARHGTDATAFPGVAELLDAAGLSAVPPARVGVFVGNAWDPQEGRETPWLDLAYQLAGNEGVALLGAAATTTPPGTDGFQIRHQPTLRKVVSDRRASLDEQSEIRPAMQTLIKAATAHCASVWPSGRGSVARPHASIQAPWCGV